MPLELSVPGERAAPPKDLEIRPRHAKAWIESLPLAQSMEAGRRIRTNLAAMSRSKIDTDERIQVLEAYRPIVSVVLEELDAVYAKSVLPLTTKAREALTLAREIATELAHGYKIAILDKTGRLIGFGTKKQIPPLVFRAMEFVAHGVRASYKSYTPLAPGLWKELHQLYLHAEKEGFAAEVQDAESRLSIFDLYVESLLLALTDPYRLIQGEVDKTIGLVRAQRGLTTLAQSQPPTNPRAHFLVPCDTDKPPKPIAAAAAANDTGGPNWRLLDANPIADRLKQRRQAVEMGHVSAATSKQATPDQLALIAKLVVLWGDPPKRTYRRDPMDTNVAICAGIRAISHFVALEPKVDPDIDIATIRSGITVPLISVPDDDVSLGLQVNEWEVVNQSAGGLKVRRNGATNQSITVGEAIGVKFMGRQRWTIGVVRWITALEDGGLEFGIQFLAPAARTVAVQPTTSAGAQVKLGLLLHESDRSSEADTLLTPTGTFADLREFEVEDDGKVMLVRATGLIEKTGRFELFQISPS